MSLSVLYVRELILGGVTQLAWSHMRVPFKHKTTENKTSSQARSRFRLKIFMRNIHISLSYSLVKKVY